MPRGDGSLPVFQIQTKHGDAVPPAPWYHSGLITAHRGVVRTRLRKIHKIRIWSLPSDLAWIYAQNAQIDHSVTEVRTMIAIIVFTVDRQAILYEIAVFYDNLYQNSKTTVHKWCFVAQFEKEVQGYEIGRYSVPTLLSLTSHDEQMRLVNTAHRPNILWPSLQN